MALLTCPECGKEISDQAKACPHCGYPIHTQEDPSPGEPSEAALVPTQPSQEDVPLQDAQPSKEPAEPPKKKKKKGKIVAAVLAALLVVGGLAGFFIHQSIQKSNYRHIMLEAKAGMYISVYLSAIQCDLTSQVWHDAIYKEENFETEDYVVPGNFSASIMKLYASTGTRTRVKGLEDTRDLIKKYMSQLQNPPSEFRDMYDTLNDLYLVYQSAVELAINPTGSLTQYNNNKNKYYSEFKSVYAKMDAMLPDPPSASSSSTSSISSSGASSISSSI